MVEGRVAGDAKDPCREGDLALLVFRDRLHELGENALRDVLGVVMVAHDAQHVAEDIVGIPRVEEVQRARVAGLRQADRPGDQSLVLAAGGVGLLRRRAGMEACDLFAHVVQTRKGTSTMWQPCSTTRHLLSRLFAVLYT